MLLITCIEKRGDICMKRKPLSVGIGIFLFAAFISFVINKKDDTYRFHVESINYEKSVRSVNDKNEKNLDSIGLCGYDDKNVYTFKSLDDGYEYDITENGLTNAVYISNASAILSNQLYENNIIICELFAEEQMYFVVKKIGKNIEETLFQLDCSGMPTVEIVGDYLLLNYGINNNGLEQSLILYNLKTGDEKIIGKYVLFTDTEGNSDGDLLQASDGFENGVIFEIIKFHNENINPDETGKAELFYYSFEKKSIQKLPIKLSRKLLYAVGDTSCVITSDYAYKRPLDDVGTMYILKNGKYIDVEIPGVESGNDIIQAYRINGEVIALQTLNDIILIDTEKMIYDKTANSNPIRSNGNTIGYISSDGNLNIYKFSD